MNPMVAFVLKQFHGIDVRELTTAERNILLQAINLRLDETLLPKEGPYLLTLRDELYNVVMESPSER